MKKALIIIISLILIGTGLFVGTKYYLDNKRTRDLYEETGDTYTKPGSPDGIDVISFDEADDGLIKAQALNEPEDTDDTLEEDEVEDSITYSFRYDGPWENQIDVDLAPLMAQYPDVKGWLFFENEDISYPIVQGETDDKYIRKSYSLEDTTSGSIFMESLNMPDWSDAHTIIYGHNMKNRTMFGSLRNYVNHPKYYDYHKYFQIISINSEGNTVKTRYKVFAYGKTTASSKLYTVCHENDLSFAAVLKNIQNNLTVADDVNVYDDDRIVTLSTCSVGENRMVVCAVRCDEVIR